MLNAADVGARGGELEELVGLGDFEYFFDRALDFARDLGKSSDRYEALTRKGNYSQLKKELRGRRITKEEFETECNRLVMDALEQKDLIYEFVILQFASASVPKISRLDQAPVGAP